MTNPPASRPSQFPTLLLCMLLTLLAVLAHGLLPERRMTISSAREGAAFFLAESGNQAQSVNHWVDQGRFHYACQFPQATAQQGCGFAFLLSSVAVSQGIDLTPYKTLHLSVRYTGKAQYLRVGLRNFDARFSRIEDLNSPKFNFVNIPTRDLDKPIVINMSEFAVAEWWTTMYNLPREYARPDLSNATVLNIDLQGQEDLAGSAHDIRIDQVEFVGDWISAERWYLGILCLWMILGTAFGISQWIKMRRAHGAQRRQIAELARQKEKFEKLSTTDALTGVLNRHGIDQFIAALRETEASSSVVVIDLDHFKRVNDQRGHDAGDRVLRTLGEILRGSIRASDAVGRWGGEEFVLVCPGATLAQAADLAEKLRQMIANTAFNEEDPLSVTASFGVAVSNGPQDFEDAFRQADQALYLAKSRGRNCVVAASDDQMHKVTGASKGTWALVTGRFKLHR